MIKALGVSLVLLTLAGCAGVPVSFSLTSDCSGGREATYNCQIERYNKSGY
jgi:hypothetical protein